jgi:hypothetical protein
MLRRTAVIAASQHFTLHLSGAVAYSLATGRTAPIQSAARPCRPVLRLRRLIPDRVSKPQHKLLSLLVFRAEA